MGRRVAVVTGSSSGIGAATARRLAADGFSVAVCSNANATGGESVAADIEAAGGTARHFSVDVCDDASIAALFDAVEAGLGPAEVLVNNAGVAEAFPLLDGARADWARMLDVNLLSVVACTNEFARRFRGERGAVVNTSSIRGELGGAREGGAAYGAAKAAVNSVTKVYAQALAPKIRVNAVAPGGTSTETFGRIDEELRASWLEDQRIGRFVDPDEIADAIAFLVGNEATTGQILVVDGGFLLDAR